MTIQEIPESERRVNRVNESELRVNGESTALESSKVGKSEQSERILYRDTISTYLEGKAQPVRIDTMLAIIVTRSMWPVYRAVITDMIRDKTLDAFDRDGHTYVSLRRRL